MRVMNMSKHWSILIFLFLAVEPTLAEVRILPTPQYLEPLPHSLRLAPGSSITVSLGPKAASMSPKLRLAAGFLRRELNAGGQQLRLSEQPFGQEVTARPTIFLWDYSADQNPPIQLNLLDRQTLSASSGFGQRYVIRTPDRNAMWVIGRSGQG